MKTKINVKFVMEGQTEIDIFALREFDDAKAQRLVFQKNLNETAELPVFDWDGIIENQAEYEIGVQTILAEKTFKDVAAKITPTLNGPRERINDGLRSDSWTEKNQQWSDILDGSDSALYELRALNANSPCQPCGTGCHVVGTYVYLAGTSSKVVWPIHSDGQTYRGYLKCQIIFSRDDT